MKIFRIILLIALLLGSVAVAGWLCLVGVGVVLGVGFSGRLSFRHGGRGRDRKGPCVLRTACGRQEIQACCGV